MSKNARELLKQWWNEQYRIARTPGTPVKQQYNSAEEAVAAYRAKGDFDRSATAEVAEKRMGVISELRNFVNPDATLSEELERPGPGDPKTVPNNQVQAVWTSIATIAAIAPDNIAGSWTASQLQAMRIQQLAATINTCGG